jgi:hypothetical protein
VIFLATKRRARSRPSASAPEAGGDGRALGRYGEPLAAGRPARSGAPAPLAGAEGLSAAIASAEASGDERGLVELYLALGRKLSERGNAGEAARSLAKSIRLAAKLGQKGAHAQARLELGDISREGGDLTTACEHWQIARGLFVELEKKTELEKTETRMRDNGCPTDWVLNDF